MDPSDGVSASKVGADGLGSVPSSAQSSVSPLTPERTTLCALSLFYVHQTLTSASLGGNTSASGEHDHCYDENMENDAFHAREVAEKVEQVMMCLPRLQREALGAASKGEVLSDRVQERICHFLTRHLSLSHGREDKTGASKSKSKSRSLESSPCDSLGDLKERLSQFLGPGNKKSVLEIHFALDTFIQAMETPDDLNMFFLQLKKLLCRSDTHHASSSAGLNEAERFQAVNNSLVEPNSILGVFLRECCVSFELLSFEGVGRLLRRVKAYQGLHEQGLSTSCDKGEGVAETGTKTTKAKAAAAAAAGKRLDSKDSSVLLSQYLSDVGARDYYSALSSLHTYFDYSAGSHQGLAQLDTRLGNFEHATLEMAQLHVEFGHMWEGIKALEETLRSSQQNTNHICLIHALALMCQVLATPEYCFNQSKLATKVMGCDAGFLYILQDCNKRHLHLLLHHCMQRARALKLPHIEAFACVEILKQKLHWSPNNGKASEEMEQIRKLLDEIFYLVNNESAETDSGSAALEDLGLDFNSKLNIYTDTANTRDMLRAGPGSVKKLVEDLILNLQLVQVTLWESKGFREYAISLAKQILAKDPKRETALVLLTSYTLLQKGIHPARKVLREYEEDLKGRKHQKKKGGSTEEEVEEVEEGRGREMEFHCKSKHIRCAGMMVDFSDHMYNGRYSSARKVASGMALLCNASEMFDVNIFIESQMCKFLALLESGEYQGSHEAINLAFGMAFKSGLRRQCLQCLLLYGRQYLALGDPLSALPYVISAYQQSKSMQMDAIFNEAVYMLAYVWMSLGGPLLKKATRLLSRHLSSIASKCSLEIQGRAHLLLAKCLLSLQGDREKGKDKDKDKDKAQQRENVNQNSKALLLKHLHCARKVFITAGHTVLSREACHLSALVFNSFGMAEEREEAAKDFMNLQKKIADSAINA